MRKRAVFICVISAILLLACTSCGPAVQDTVRGSEQVIIECASEDSLKPVIVQSSVSPVAAETPAPPESTELTVAAEPTVVPAEGEDNCATSISDRASFYLTLSELDAAAQAVMTGECVSAEPVFQNDTLYTLSQIKVGQVFKGDLTSGDHVFFVEMGGRVTNGEYNKGCNLPPIPKSAQSTVDKQIVVGSDWYYPLKEGEKVLLFAGDSSGFLKEFDQPLYAIIGDYDGKLFLLDDGSYAKPLPAETDKHVYGDNSLVITIKELEEHYQ